MKYYVIAPDSSGSKGDEALMRGVLNVLQGADITVLTTPSLYNTWQTELLDRCYDFSEKIVAFDNIAKGIQEKGILIVVGADVIDGTCGVMPSLSRIKAIKRIIDLGGSAYVFCSFRQNVDSQILNAIDEIDRNVYWLLRDQHSVESFAKQTGKTVEYFPDFAYYCEKYSRDNRGQIITELINNKKNEGRVVIGLNFSQHSFMSFFSEMTEVSRKKYIESVVCTIKEEVEKPFFVLISHDTRTYGSEWWSDTQFQELAATVIEDEYMIVSDDIIYPELLMMLSEFDYVISGRMHFAIASLRCGVVPIIYTGSGEEGKYTMSDKCKGMLDERIGNPDFVANNSLELRFALKKLCSLKNILKVELQNQNQINLKREEELKKSLRIRLGLNDKENDAFINCENDEIKIKVLLTMVRNVFKEQDFINDGFREQIENIQEQLNDKQQQLDDKQKQLNDKQRQINEKTEEIKHIWKRLNEITEELTKCNEIIIGQAEKYDKKIIDDLNIQKSIKETLNEQGEELDRIKSTFPIRMWYKEN